MTITAHQGAVAVAVPVVRSSSSSIQGVRSGRSRNGPSRQARCSTTVDAMRAVSQGRPSPALRPACFEAIYNSTTVSASPPRGTRFPQGHCWLVVAIC